MLNDVIDEGSTWKSVSQNESVTFDNLIGIADVEVFKH